MALEGILLRSCKHNKGQKTVNSWLGQFVRAAVAKIAVTVVLGSSAIFALTDAWVYLRRAPWPVWGLLVVGLLALLGLICGALALWLSTPKGSSFVPRYLMWYRNPLRCISWDFDNYIGGRCGGQPVEILGFRCKFKINRGDSIVLKNAFIESRPKGFRRDLSISRLGTAIQADVPVTSKIIQSKHWHVCHVRLDGWTKEQLVENTTGIRFVFEYDDKVFIRAFSQNDLIETIDRFWLSCNQTTLVP